MQQLTGWLFSFMFAVILVVCILAGAAYTQAADYQNQTDSFGQTHSQLENNTARMITNASTSATGISSGFLIFGAALILILICIAAVLLTRQPKW